MLWGNGRRNNGLVARIRGVVLGQSDGLETAGGRRYSTWKGESWVECRGGETIDDGLGGGGGGMGGVM